MNAAHVYLVVCRYGLMGIFQDFKEAKELAREIHESDEGEEFYIPVWVRSYSLNRGGVSWDEGMFPDRTTHETPGRWVSARGRDGRHKKNYPTPKIPGVDIPGWVYPTQTKIEKLREKEGGA